MRRHLSVRNYRVKYINTRVLDKRERMFEEDYTTVMYHERKIKQKAA